MGNNPRREHNHQFKVVVRIPAKKNEAFVQLVSTKTKRELRLARAKRDKQERDDA